MTDTTPLKGIPSRHSVGGFSSPLSRAGTTPGGVGALGSSPSGVGPVRPSPRALAGRKDGGIKLLDINEQPIGFAQAKKRKRQQGTIPCLFQFTIFSQKSISIFLELEAAQKAASDSQTAPPNPGLASSGEEEAASAPESVVEQPAPTPDYAAGLLPTNSNPPATPLAAPATPMAPSISTLTPIKATARPISSSISSVPPASPAAATVQQVVRIAPPPTLGTAVATVPATAYRVIQSPASVGAQPGALGAAAPPAQAAAAPQKKSVALMLTVSKSFLQSF